MRENVFKAFQPMGMSDNAKESRKREAVDLVDKASSAPQ